MISEKMYGFKHVMLILFIVSFFYSGFGEVFALPHQTIHIQYPYNYTIFQRLNDSSGDIIIRGTYDGNPDIIESRFNDEHWKIIDPHPTSGKFSGTIHNEKLGQGLLQVRFHNDTSIIDSVYDIAIGDVFVIAGQSNAIGKAHNIQHLNKTNQYVVTAFFNGSWGVEEDNSPFPLVSGYIIQNEKIPVGFIRTALDGTSIKSWQRGGYAYDSMIKKIDNATNGTMNICAILFYQGETDVGSKYTLPQDNYEMYKSKLSDFINNSLKNTKAKVVMVGQIGQNNYVVNRWNLDSIRKAQQESWDKYYVAAGPVTYDIGPLQDSLHFQSDKEIQILSKRWFASIEHYLYGKGQGRGPLIKDIELSSTGEILTLTFDKNITIADWMGNHNPKAEGFIIRDGFNLLNDSDILKTNVKENILEIFLDKPISKYAILSFAGEDDAVGKYVIRDTDWYALPAEPIFSYMLYYPHQNNTHLSIPSPRQQMTDGIGLTNVECIKGLIPLKKLSTGLAACVTTQTAERLIEHNWGKMIQH